MTISELNLLLALYLSHFGPEFVVDSPLPCVAGDVVGSVGGVLLARGDRFSERPRQQVRRDGVERRLDGFCVGLPRTNSGSTAGVATSCQNTDSFRRK